MLGFLRRTPERAGRIDIDPPAPMQDRSGLAIVAIARNEAAHILDWLAFHCLAGAREVILYDNSSSDDTARIARGFSGLPVTVVPWQIDARLPRPVVFLPQQVLAYVHAICTFGARFRRMAFIDIDEFLVPETALTIADALAPLGDVPNISLPWVMFGHDGHQTMPEAAMPFAYTARARQTSGPLLRWKCIVDPCDATQVSPHKFQTRSLGDRTINLAGAMTTNKRRAEDFVTFDRLRLNHYYLRSRAEMEQKITRGAVSGVPESKRRSAVETKAALIERDSIRDDSAVRFLARHGIEDTRQLRDRFRVDR